MTKLKHFNSYRTDTQRVGVRISKLRGITCFRHALPKSHFGFLGWQKVVVVLSSEITVPS